MNYIKMLCVALYNFRHNASKKKKEMSCYKSRRKNFLLLVCVMDFQ